MGSSKKHKKHKREKYEVEKPPTLKLILKVGNSSTPEHSDSPGPVAVPTPSYTITPDDESLHSSSSFHHKKSKKKKKKKERDHDRHERKKKHHHKEKRRHGVDDSSQDNISFLEDSSADIPCQMKEVSSKHLLDNFSNDSSAHREARVCVQVLRQKQSKTPFQRVLEYLQQQLEKKDVKQVFAYPVTDQIAPGYSQTITQPMDFSTMRQKINDNGYKNINEYISDLRLMCNNAMVYNRPDTMYYKAAKRLLHAGLKFLSSDKLRQLAVSFPDINLVPAEQLGFEIRSGIFNDDYSNLNNLEKSEDSQPIDLQELSPKRKILNLPVESKFEAIPDDVSPEEILETAQKAAQAAATKLAAKRQRTNIGYLVKMPDGTTTFQRFNTHDDTETPNKKVTFVQFSGKGSGQQLGHKDDRKNASKSVKPSSHCSVGSYAPSYDSTFANLTKEETELIYETYGDETATMYAESILNFAKDCDYALTMVDNLLDLLTGGEHRKAKAVIDEHKRFREEEEKVRELMEQKPVISLPPNGNIEGSKADVNTKIEIDQLKSLSELGIDTSFLNAFEQQKDNGSSQNKINNNNSIILDKHPPQTEQAERLPTEGLSNRGLQTERIPSGGLQTERIPSGGLQTERIPSGGLQNDRIPSGGLQTERIPSGGLQNDRIPSGGLQNERIPSGGLQNDRIPSGGLQNDRIPSGGLQNERIPSGGLQNERIPTGGLQNERVLNGNLQSERILPVGLPNEKFISVTLPSERITSERVLNDKLRSDRLHPERLQSGKIHPERITTDRRERISNDRIHNDRTINERITNSSNSHISQILQQPRDSEIHLVEDKIPQLSAITKQVAASSIISVPIRKPLTIVPETSLVSTATNTVLPTISNTVDEVVTLEDDSSVEEEPCVGVGVDFESELREFLESDTALSGFPLHDDKTIEEMLSES